MGSKAVLSMREYFARQFNFFFGSVKETLNNVNFERGFNWQKRQNDHFVGK